jgi:hypothetical protein
MGRKDVLLSPVYQSEHPDAFADLVAASGAGRVQKVLAAIGSNQGWPLSLAKKNGRIGQQLISPEELNVIAARSPPRAWATHVPPPLPVVVRVLIDAVPTGIIGMLIVLYRRVTRPN